MRQAQLAKRCRCRTHADRLTLPARGGNAFTREPARLVRSEEDGDARNVVRPSQPSHRQASTHAFSGLALNAGHSQAFGFGHAGRDRVDPNVAARKFVGQSFGDRIHRCLRRRVDEGVRDRIRARNAAEIDDTTAARTEGFDRLLGRQNGAQHVRVELSAELRFRHLLQRGGSGTHPHC